MKKKLPLYQRIMGAEFSQLPPVLQRFHSFEDEIEVRGTLSVEYGTTKLQKLIARMGGFPPEGKDQPLILNIKRTQQGGEIWTRNINGFVLQTFQYDGNGVLIEGKDGLYIYIKLQAVNGKMIYKSVGCRFLGIPLPGILSITGDAEIQVTGDEWFTEVNVVSRLFGPIVKYYGTLRYPEQK